MPIQHVKKSVYAGDQQGPPPLDPRRKTTPPTNGRRDADATADRVGFYARACGEEIVAAPLSAIASHRFERYLN